MDQIGIGGFKNFSHDVMFVHRSAYCGSADFNSSTGRFLHTFWNARSQSSFGHNEYGQDVSATCLSDSNGFSVPPVLQVDVEPGMQVRCLLNRPKLEDIKSGTVNIRGVPNCPWRLTHVYCQAEYTGSCAITLELGDNQILVIEDFKNASVAAISMSTTLKSSQKLDAATVRMAAMYIDFGLEATPFQLAHITSFQAGKRSIVEVKRDSFLTAIDVRMFLSGLLVMLTIFSTIIVVALVSHCTMVRTQRSDYALGLHLVEVARFART